MRVARVAGYAVCAVCATSHPVVPLLTAHRGPRGDADRADIKEDLDLLRRLVSEPRSEEKTLMEAMHRLEGSSQKIYEKMMEEAEGLIEE